VPGHDHTPEPKPLPAHLATSDKLIYSIFDCYMQPLRRPDRASWSWCPNSTLLGWARASIWQQTHVRGLSYVCGGTHTRKLACYSADSLTGAPAGQSLTCRPQTYLAGHTGSGTGVQCRERERGGGSMYVLVLVHIIWCTMQILYSLWCFIFTVVCV
jgi:hypothetical protein